MEFCCLSWFSGSWDARGKRLVLLADEKGQISEWAHVYTLLGDAIAGEEFDAVWYLVELALYACSYLTWLPLLLLTTGSLGVVSVPECNIHSRSYTDAEPRPRAAETKRRDLLLKTSRSFLTSTLPLLYVRSHRPLHILYQRRHAGCGIIIHILSIRDGNRPMTARTE